MLEDVILIKKVRGKTISVLWYSIEKEDRHNEDNHTHFYEVRVSYNDKFDNWYTDSEFYVKKDAIRIHAIVCKELEQEYQNRIKEEQEKLECKKAVLQYVA